MTPKSNKNISLVIKKSFLEKKYLFLSAIIIFILLFLKSYYFLDPDFGFHIKMGDLILSSGIPLTDPFTYTMPSFPYVDHEWLLDVFMYLFFNSFGWGFLAFIFSLIAVLTLVIPVFKYKKFILLPMLFACFTLFLPMGIRPQVFSWVLFSLLIFVFLNKQIYKKLRFLIPVLFLVWANLHGSFAIGFVVFLIFISIRVFENRRIDIIDLSIFIFSFFATFINPYGIQLWREVAMTTFDTSLRSNVDEWKPYIFSFYPALWFYIPFSLILFLRFRNSFDLFQKSFYILLLVAGLMSSRNMAFWALFALPILIECLNLLNEEVRKIKYGEDRLKKAYIFFVILVVFAFVAPLLKDEKQFMLFNKNYFYPDKAVIYLRSNPSSGNIFSDYNWGGYLIWNYPEKKVFVDGRMPSWKWEEVGISESSNAFLDYNNLLQGKIKFEVIANKYEIDTVLWSMPEEVDQSFISNLIEAEEARKIGKYGSIASQLENGGWKIVYKDETSIIFRKPQIEKLE